MMAKGPKIANLHQEVRPELSLDVKVCLVEISRDAIPPKELGRCVDLAATVTAPNDELSALAAG